jgi:hypothetical protein
MNDEQIFKNIDGILCYNEIVAGCDELKQSIFRKVFNVE